MHTIRQAYEWLCVAVVTFGLVSAPMLACQSAPLTAGEQETFDAQVAAGDEDGAVATQTQANERQVRGILDFALGWIPNLPESAKTTIVAAGAPLGASLLFKRPREHYGKALKAIAQSAVELNPVGASVAPGKAAMQIGEAVKSIARAWGLSHTTDDPAELERVAAKLKAKQAADQTPL